MGTPPNPGERTALSSIIKRMDDEAFGHPANSAIEYRTAVGHTGKRCRLERNFNCRPQRTDQQQRHYERQSHQWRIGLP